MSTVERSNWRDERISKRHRIWGFDCPMVDIDFLGLEYDTGEPIALVEYKHEKATIQKSKHPSYQALIKLGTRAGIPVFAVRYAHDFSWWRVVPLNELARNNLSEPTSMSERGWVRFLYKLRGKPMPTKLIVNLS